MPKSAPSGGVVGDGEYAIRGNPTPFEAQSAGDSLIVSPEEAATRDQLQGLAKRRASERGMQYAAGMREPMYVKQARAVINDAHSTAQQRAIAASVIRNYNGATR